VAAFLELVVAAEWFELRETEGKTVARVAILTVPVRIVELRLELLEDPAGGCLKIRKGSPNTEVQKPRVHKCSKYGTQFTKKETKNL
jgi:hypothetical protein